MKAAFSPDAQTEKEDRISAFHSAFCLLPWFWRMVLGPFLFYAVWYFLLSFPLVMKFNSEFFADRWDGYQMVWDLWWVRHAIVDLHQSLFTTGYLHYPYGTSLLLHSLMPFNGLLSIPLAAVLTEIQVFNMFVILAFAGSGLTAFWLCWKVTRSYWPSIAGGFAFAFCSYRWAHSFGHLHLISTEWTPLYVLGLLSLLLRPRTATAIATAIALLLALLCDQYQFLDCLLVTVIVLLWWGWSGDARQELRRAHVIALGVFALTAALTCGPIVMAMAHEADRAPLLRTHDPEMYSADMLGPWVPDWVWLYNGYTRFLWNSPTAFYVEKSVCLGPAVVIAAAFAFFPRRRRPRAELGSLPLFAAISVVFIALCFGPTWRFWTMPVTTLTPYRALATLLPSLQVAGCPGRMIIIAQLAVSVLAAAGLSRLGDKPGGARSTARPVLLVILFGISMVIESQPRVLMSVPAAVPKWVELVRDDPSPGAVIDLVEEGGTLDLFYQTVHHRPIAMGEISRISSDTNAATQSVLDAVAQGRYDLLAREGFGFIVARTSAPPLALSLIYSDRRVRLYRLPAIPEAAGE